MSNSYGQDGWGQQPATGDQWGQGGAGQAPYGQGGFSGQHPADPGVPQYGAYAQPDQGYGQHQQFGQAPYGSPQGDGQGAGYGQNQALGGYDPANPFAAPQPYGGMGGGGHMERPGTLKAACVITWVIAGFAILGGLALAAVDPSDVGVSSPYGDSFGGFAAALIIAALLYAGMAMLIWKGSNVGRIILTVLFSLSLLGGVANIAQGVNPGTGVVGLILAVLVLVFLWQRSSTEYIQFRQRTKH